MFKTVYVCDGILSFSQIHYPSLSGKSRLRIGFGASVRQQSVASNFNKGIVGFARDGLVWIIGNSYERL